MRRLLAILALALAFGLPAPAARAGVGYQVAVDAPQGVVAGVVEVAARAAGGVGEAEHAAYHVRATGTWVEAESVALDRAGGGRFVSRTLPWDSTVLPNGRYDLEVRIWGEVPPYEPDQPKTFARRVVTVSVENPPPVPVSLEATTGAPTVRIAWKPVTTADRQDFLGYRVFRKKGASCSGDGYGAVADVADPAYESGDTPKGTYCFRVAAVRTSSVEGVILSPMSEAVRIEVVPFGAAAGVPELVAGPGEAVPPPPPPLGEGNLHVSDGRYREDLPYGTRTITEALGEGEGAEEAGPDPGHNPFFIGGGLALTGAGVVLLRQLFVGAAP